MSGPNGSGDKVLERFYDSLYDGWYENVEPEFGIELVGSWTPGGLLDVGCGNGSFLREARDAGFDVTGVDISSVALDKAALLVPEATLVRAPAEHLPFEDDSFDYVTCLGSLEHFEDPYAAAAEISRVLKPEGRALIVVPNSHHLRAVLRNAFYGVSAHDGQLREFLATREQWRDLLEESGLRVTGIGGYDQEPPHGRFSLRGFLQRLLMRFVPVTMSYCFVIDCLPRRSVDNLDRWCATVLPVDLPIGELEAGKEYWVKLTIENNGFKAWMTPDFNIFPVNLGYVIQDRTGRQVGEGRTALERPVVPGGRRTLRTSFTTPDTPGEYEVSWDMVKEREFWFAELGNVPLTQIITVA